MGYTTEFEGVIIFNKPLSEPALREINDFIDRPHARCGGMRKDQFSACSCGAPRWRCDWDVGMYDITWNECEKSYDMYEWLHFLNEKFFKPWGVGLDGDVFAQGERKDDRWAIKVRGNEIAKHEWRRVLGERNENLRNS